MKYLGSKNKLSKELAPIIQSYIKEDTEFYIEPFVGGANMIDKIKFDRKVGSDIHKYLVALLHYIQDSENLLPPTVTEEEYNKVKDSKDLYDDWYVGLVGFCATFGAKWFGGYARGFKADKITPRDMPNEAIRNLEKQRVNLKNIEFLECGYDKYTNVKNSVIYCDIPYKNTTNYKTGDFDYEKFYEWCIQMKHKNNVVLVSEYNMPDDKFECIWSKEYSTSVSLGDSKHSKRTEKLFLTI